MARKKIYYVPGDSVPGISSQKQWMYENGTEYIGSYHRYKSTGEVFTESTYLNGVSKPLIPYVDLGNINNKNTFEYNKLTTDKFKDKYKTPIPYTPTPTKEDFSRGYMIRYVVSQFNFPNIYEVSQKNFKELDDFLYIKKEFRWKIENSLISDGKVEELNKRVISVLKLDIPEIHRFFTNLTQFSVITKVNQKQVNNPPASQQSLVTTSFSSANQSAPTYGMNISKY